METVILKIILLFIMGVIPFMFGILPIKVLQYLTKTGNKSYFVGATFSVFSCFASGVILGVSLIEIFPEAKESFAQLGKHDELFTKYPIAEFFVGVGFILIYFLEEFITIFFGHTHEHHENIFAKRKPSQRSCITNSATTINENYLCDVKSSVAAHCLANEKNNLAVVSFLAIDYKDCGENIVNGSFKNSNLPMTIKPLRLSDEKQSHAGSSLSQRSYTDSSMSEEISSRTSFRKLQHTESDTDESYVKDRDHQKAVIGAVLLVVALFIHTSLEGFAFGIQKDSISVGSLFIGIIVHKILVFFSVGINLTQALPSHSHIVIGLILMLALFSPLGGIIGIIVQATESEGASNGILSTILISLSIGTFLYIAFLEILAPERHKLAPKLLQWLGFALGFLIMAFIIFFSHPGHSHSGHDNHK